MENLFDKEKQIPIWKHEWKDMPEFVQLNKLPCQKIVVNFQVFKIGSFRKTIYSTMTFRY